MTADTTSPLPPDNDGEEDETTADTETDVATGETSRDERFTKDDRLRNGKEFSRVFQGGRRRKGATVEFIWKPSAGNRTRLGLVVSRKSGKAVQRNRIKRLTREVFRRNRHRFPFTIDLVVRAYPRKEPIPTFQGVEKDFLDLADMLTRNLRKGTTPQAELPPLKGSR